MSLPSLLLIPDRYKATKLYSQLPQSGAGDMVATRATTATRVNPAGLIEVVGIDVPRIDYTGGGCPSLLIEQAATNLLLHSEEFDNVYWSKPNLTVTADAAVAPDGTTTMDNIVPTAVSGQHRVDRSTTSTNQIHTLSIFAKANGYNFISLRMDTIGASFNLATGMVEGSVNPGVTARISETFTGSGIWRVSITALAAVNAIVRYSVGSTSGIAPTFTGDGVSGVLFWGAQFELAPFVTSYIPTVASTVTRSADIVTLAGATALIGQTAGTIFVEALYNASIDSIADDQPIIVVGTDANNSSSILLQGSTGANPNRVIGRTFNGGVSQALIVSPNAQVSGVIKIAYTYTANSFKLFVNGVKVGEDLSGTLPTGGNIFFGNFDASGALFTIRLNAASLEKIVISEAEAIALTTI